MSRVMNVSPGRCQSKPLLQTFTTRSNKKSFIQFHKRWFFILRFGNLSLDSVAGFLQAIKVKRTGPILYTNTQLGRKKGSQDERGEEKGGGSQK